MNHRQPWYQDDHVTLLLGDAADMLAQLPAASVDCVVTSPPYYRVRDYGHPDQIGNEPTPRSYVERLRNVFQQVHRVLRDDGTCWLNLADTYATGSGARRCVTSGMPALPAKNLLGIPWRTALALQDDGWILRNEIIWHKPNALPESARNRLTRRHEHLFLLTKQPTYAFDLDPIRQPYTGDRTLSRRAHHSANKPNTVRGTWPHPRTCSALPGPSHQPAAHQHTPAHSHGRNPGTVWTIATRPTRHAHTAAYPIDLPLRCVAAGSRPGALVLDPFSGSGSTVEAAVRLGRRALAIDLREDFHCLALARLRVVSGAL
jgi:site-specific DNA-methyltransferase (cytosine-N4-specific)